MQITQPAWSIEQNDKAILAIQDVHDAQIRKVSPYKLLVLGAAIIEFEDEIRVKSLVDGGDIES